MWYVGDLGGPHVPHRQTERGGLMGVTRRNKQINITLPEQTINELRVLINDMNLIACSNRSVTIAVAVHEFYKKNNLAAEPQQFATD